MERWRSGGTRLRRKLCYEVCTGQVLEGGSFVVVGGWAAETRGTGFTCFTFVISYNIIDPLSATCRSHRFNKNWY